MNFGADEHLFGVYIEKHKIDAGIHILPILTLAMPQQLSVSQHDLSVEDILQYSV
jgi:hypothetical protein